LGGGVGVQYITKMEGEQEKKRIDDKGRKWKRRQ
jgi:hypothetical protein